jgi:sugar phosphate permease
LATEPELQAGQAEVNATFRKVAWRIIPLLMACYVIAFIDRGNVGFAKLQFMGELHFSEAVYGLGGGLFYLGYSVFEVPSNLMLARVGVRLTLLRIMVLWGLCSAALALMSAPSHYYILRAMLGAAEAGFFPGVLFYLTTWIPASRRGQFTAYFMAAIAISGIVSGPISGSILHFSDGALGLRGWQWLFISEGIPAAIMGLVAYFTLADRPETAHWLNARQISIITAELRAEEKIKEGHSPRSFASALRDPRLYILMGMSIGLIAGGAGIPLWLPTIIRQSGVSNVWSIGLMSAVPYVVAMVVQQLIARHSDRTQERRWHAALPTFACALGWLLLAQFNSNPWISLALLTVMTAGYLGATGPYWTMPALYLSGAGAAGGIALITTAGGVGAFFAPTIVGWIASVTGTLSYALIFYAAIMAIGAVVMLVGTRPLATRTVPDRKAVEAARTT